MTQLYQRTAGSTTARRERSASACDWLRDEAGASSEAEARLEQCVNGRWLERGCATDPERFAGEGDRADLPALLEFFEDPSVLIGTAGDGRTPGV